MKKMIWMFVAVIGLGLVFVGVTRFDTSAREAELYLDVALDLEEEEFEDNYLSYRRFGGRKTVLRFISNHSDVRENIIDQAALYEIEPAHYVLAVTVSTYSDQYDLEVVIETIQNLEGVALDDYIKELNDFIIDNGEAMKATIDTIKDIYQPQIQAIKVTYMDDVKALIVDIKAATTDEDIEALSLELEALKETIQAEVSVIREAYEQALLDEGIALEGLYGMFAKQANSTFQTRMARFETRFPRLYNRVKNHFLND